MNECVTINTYSTRTYVLVVTHLCIIFHHDSPAWSVLTITYIVWCTNIILVYSIIAIIPPVEVYIVTVTYSCHGSNLYEYT